MASVVVTNVDMTISEANVSELFGTLAPISSMQNLGCAMFVLHVYCCVSPRASLA